LPPGNAERLDVTFLEGRKSSPLVVFIHGIGMDKYIWTDPERSRVLAGRFPLKVLLARKPRARIIPERPGLKERLTAGTRPRRVVSVFHMMKERGFHVLAWSQERPASSASIAVEELAGLLHRFGDFAQHGIILVGHSRGGLIARRYALDNPGHIDRIVYIASPHRGSSLAGWARIVSKMAVVLAPLVQTPRNSTIKTHMKRILDFIKSRAVRELLPDSEFLASLRRPLDSRIKTLATAGNDPSLFRLYRWHMNCIRLNSNTFKYKMEPKVTFEFPASITGALPSQIVPDELRQGLGDGLVSVESAQGVEADERGVFRANHASILFIPEGRERVVSFLTGKM